MSGGVGGQFTGGGVLATSGAMYGSWMIAASRNRKPRKDSGKARVEGSGERCSWGSRFNVLDGEGPSDESEVQPNVLIGRGQDTVQVLSSGGGERLAKGVVVPSGARKPACDGYRSGLKVHKGKENRQLTRSVLAGWLPPNFGHSGAGSSKHSESLDPYGVVALVSSNHRENGVVNLVLGSPDDGRGHGNRVPEPKQ
ncbi:hypothetical protein V6N13_018796 [Hibiscus sabdariffa]|uniref:Uncharacterized protein n=1 Tax=Hibiscus sabdariffa TaxID=183260 RepID=A0ABR2EMK6_9ROSI